MTIFAYGRVSTDGQSVDAQVKALRAAGAEKVFKETASGAQTDRAQFRRALAALGKGVLLVTRLARLARSTRDILNRSTPSRRPEPDSPSTEIVIVRVLHGARDAAAVAERGGFAAR
jgi:predicted site-specific integrase-resolvase